MVTPPVMIFNLKSLVWGISFGIVLAVPFFASAETVTFDFPSWSDIDQTNPPTKAGDAPDPSDRIAYEGADQAMTAFMFCSQLSYSYVSYLTGGQVNPSSILNSDNEWEQKGNENAFLQIVCDDGVVASSSDITVTVQSNEVDYSVYYEFFMYLFSSVFFMVMVLSFMHITRKFL